MVIKDVVHLALRTRRQERGMSDVDVASLASLSINEYSDLEHVSDEWRMVVPFFKLKFLLKLFDFDISETFGSKPIQNALSKYHRISDIIKDKRLALGLSPEAFADKVGFSPVFTTIVEEHPLGLELYPLEVAMLVAKALQISPEEFVLWIVQH